MNIKLELLKKHIADYVANNLQNFEINASEIADSIAITIISEIQNVLKIKIILILRQWKR